MAQLEGGTGTGELYAITEKVLVATGEKLESLMEDSSLSVSEKVKHTHLQGERLQLVARLHVVFTTAIGQN